MGWGGVSQVDIIEAWSYVSSGECLYYMPTSDILGYCVFDQVIDLADSAATAAVKEDMASNLDGTGANYSVVSADVSDSDWFKGTPITPYYYNCTPPCLSLSIYPPEKICRFLVHISLTYKHDVFCSSSCLQILAPTFTRRGH